MAALFDSSLWVSTLLHNPKVRKAVCNQHLKKYDVNQNGQLEEEELASLVSDVCKAMHVTAPTSAELHQSFQQFDKSRSDGLTSQEFAHFFEHLLRASLPFMDTPDAPKKSEGEETRSRETFGSKFIPSSAQDAKLVTVTDMGGNSRWGPSLLDKNDTVSKVVELVEAANGSIALKLLLGDRILDDSLSLASLTADRELRFSMYMLAAESLAAEALQALEKCPDVGTSQTLATTAWSGADAVRIDPYKSSDYVSWVQSDAKVVIKRLQQLRKVGVKGDAMAKDLVLKCLAIPPNDELWDNGGWGCVVELFPDELTCAAAKLLPIYADTEDPDILNVCISWVRRMFCFHGYFSFDVGDHPCTTSNMDTVLQILEMLPVLFKGTKLQRPIMRKIISVTSNYLRYIDDNVPYYDAIVNANEWKVKHMFDAIVSLTDATHPSSKCNNPWWAQRGYEFPTGGCEDDDWVDEYMYKRTHRPQIDSFLQR